MNVETVLKECQAKGISLSTDGENLKYRAPAGTVTEALKNQIQTYKPELLRHLIIDTVTDFDTRRFLTNQEFTQRYMILMRGYRSGIINERTKDEGISCLLNIWRPKKSERI